MEDKTEILKEKAFRWFALGLNIVPTVGKKPLEPWGIWQRKRQNTGDFAAQQWGRGESFGIICGKTGHGFLGAIDIDYPDQIQGFDIAKFSETFVEQTPRGGYHILFWSKKPVKNIKYTNFELIGTTLLNMYGAEPKPILTLEDLTAEFEEQAKRFGLKKAEYAQDKTAEELLAEGVSFGLRNQTVFAIARKLRDSGKTENEAGVIILEWNKTKNVPPISIKGPLPSEDILRSVHSAFSRRPRHRIEELKEYLIQRPKIVTGDFIAEEVWDRKTKPKYLVHYFDSRPDEEKDRISLGETDAKGIPAFYIPVDNAVLRTNGVVLPRRQQECSFKEVYERAEKFVFMVYDACGRESEVKLLISIAIGSWFLDRFIEDPSYAVPGSGRFAPIIPIRGPSGSGKNRLAMALMMLSYRPFFEMSTYRIPSLYRPLDLWQGTLVLDEADFGNTGEKSELTHFLDCRAQGSPIKRQDPNNVEDTHSFENFGLTILTQRKTFDDNALEDRSIPFHSEKTDKADLPTVETDEMLKEGLELQDMLLYLRLQYFKEVKIDKTCRIENVTSHRLNSSLLPAVALSKFEPSIMKIIKENVEKVERLKVEQKAGTLDGLIVNTLWEKGVFVPYTDSHIRNGYYFGSGEKDCPEGSGSGFVDSEDLEGTDVPLSVQALAEELKVSAQSLRKAVDSLGFHGSAASRVVRIGKKTYRPIFFKPSRFEQQLLEFVPGYAPRELYRKLGITEEKQE